MPIELFCSFDYRGVDRAFAEVKSKTIEAAKRVPVEAAKSFTRRVVEITPPGSKGRTGLAARRQGEAKIDRDLRAIFFPVVLKHQREERWPDVEAIYDAIMANRKGRGAPGVSPKYHVDVRKLVALRKKLYERIGFLAGGWNAAAQGLGVVVPAWVRRHGTEHGGFQVQSDADGLLVTISNAIKYNADVDGYPRRVQAALDYTEAGMLRELKYLVQHGIDQAGD